MNAFDRLVVVNLPIVRRPSIADTFFDRSVGIDIEIDVLGADDVVIDGEGNPDELLDVINIVVVGAGIEGTICLQLVIGAGEMAG